MQGRDAHPERKGVSILLVRRNAVKRQLSHWCRSVFPDLCFPVASYPHFFFHIWPTLGPFPECTCLLSKDGSWSEDFHEEQDSLWSGIIPWLLTSKEPFCTLISSWTEPWAWFTPESVGTCDIQMCEAIWLFFRCRGTNVVFLEILQLFVSCLLSPGKWSHFSSA